MAAPNTAIPDYMEPEVVPPTARPESAPRQPAGAGQPPMASNRGWQAAKAEIIRRAGSMRSMDGAMQAVNAMYAIEQERIGGFMREAVMRSQTGDMAGAADALRGAAMFMGNGGDVSFQPQGQHMMMVQHGPDGQVLGAQAFTPEQIQQVAHAYQDLPGFRKFEFDRAMGLENLQMRREAHFSDMQARTQNIELNSLAIEKAAIELELLKASITGATGLNSESVNAAVDSAYEFAYDLFEDGPMTEEGDRDNLFRAGHMGMSGSEFSMMWRKTAEVLHRGQPDKSPEEIAHLTSLLLMDPAVDVTVTPIGEGQWAVTTPVGDVTMPGDENALRHLRNFLERTRPSAVAETVLSDSSNNQYVAALGRGSDARAEGLQGIIMQHGEDGSFTVLGTQSTLRQLMDMRAESQERDAPANPGFEWRGALPDAAPQRPEPPQAPAPAAEADPLQSIQEMAAFASANPGFEPSADDLQRMSAAFQQIRDQYGTGSREVRFAQDMIRQLVPRQTGEGR